MGISGSDGDGAGVWKVSNGLVGVGPHIIVLTVWSGLNEICLIRFLGGMLSIVCDGSDKEVVCDWMFDDFSGRFMLDEKAYCFLSSIPS